MQSEKDAFIVDVRFDNANRDLVVQNELILVLFKKSELLGLYVAILWATQIGLTRQITQKQLAEYLGLTEPTYIKRRRELEKCGLLEVKSDGMQRIYIFKYVSRIPVFDPPKKLREINSYLAKMAASIRIGDERNKQLSFTPSVPKVTREPVKRFPKEQYDKVLSAFMRCKEIELLGAERNVALRATKTMFQSGRTVEQIIQCMEWLKSVQGDPDYAWARLWTMWTVQKKLPEFLAGKLQTKPKLEDERI